MNIVNKLVLLLLLVSTLGGCSSLMMKSNPQAIEAPTSESATIVFMRSSFILGGIGVELFEINDGKLSFVGSLPNETKIAHVTEPGEKVYMAYGNAADFMIARVEAGKTYYSIVRPNWGTSGFAPTPIRKSETDYNMESKNFQQWLKTTRQEKKPTAEEWFEKNKAKYQKIYDTYWQRFETKTDQEKQQRTLIAEDGI